MREKKLLLMFTLTLLLGATMASVSPVKAAYPSAVRVYIVPIRPDSVAGVAVNDVFDVQVYIDCPSEWTNTSNGIVGWRMDVHVDASVLEPMTVYLGSSGYWLYDFTQDYYYYGHEPTYGFTIDKPGGNFVDIGIFLKGFNPPEGIGVGAGGSGLICQLRYKSKSQTDYTLIDMIDFKYALPYFDGEEDWLTADLVVIDGNYNTPPFLCLHCTSSLIDLTSPVCNDWEELWPTGEGSTYHLSRWLDSNEDGQLSPCDYIQLDSTWYHVEEVTVTIHDTKSGKDHYLELLDGPLGYDAATTEDPTGTIWHEWYYYLSALYNLTSWTDDDTSGNLTVGDDVTLTELTATGSPDTLSITLDEVSTDIIVRGPEPEQPEFPLGFAIEISLIVAVIYICWRSKHKTKIAKRRITTPPKQ